MWASYAFPDCALAVFYMWKYSEKLEKHPSAACWSSLKHGISGLAGCFRSFWGYFQNTDWRESQLKKAEAAIVFCNTFESGLRPEINLRRVDWSMWRRRLFRWGAGGLVVVCGHFNCCFAKTESIKWILIIRQSGIAMSILEKRMNKH